ncbi:hypothetical protein PO909_004507 [Leuciscus waleckii]
MGSVPVALDESTDNTDTAQLTVHVRGVDDKFEVIKELLAVIPMHGQTTAQEIFRQLCGAIEDAACKALMDVGTPFSGEKNADAIMKLQEEFDRSLPRERKLKQNTGKQEILALFEIQQITSKSRYWGEDSGKNEVQGTVLDRAGRVLHRFGGSWHEGIFCDTFPKPQCIWKPNPQPDDYLDYFGFSQYARELNELTPDIKDKLPPTDSRFRPDQRSQSLEEEWKGTESNLLEVPCEVSTPKANGDKGEKRQQWQETKTPSGVQNGAKKLGRNQAQPGASSPLANERTVYDYDSGSSLYVRSQIGLEQSEYYPVPEDRSHAGMETGLLRISAD